MCTRLYLVSKQANKGCRSRKCRFFWVGNKEEKPRWHNHHHELDFLNMIDPWESFMHVFWGAQLFGYKLTHLDWKYLQKAVVWLPIEKFPLEWWLTCKKKGEKKWSQAIQLKIAWWISSFLVSKSSPAFLWDLEADPSSVCHPALFNLKATVGILRCWRKKWMFLHPSNASKVDNLLLELLVAAKLPSLNYQPSSYML